MSPIDKLLLVAVAAKLMSFAFHFVEKNWARISMLMRLQQWVQSTRQLL